MSVRFNSAADILSVAHGLDIDVGSWVMTFYAKGISSLSARSTIAAITDTLDGAPTAYRGIFTASNGVDIQSFDGVSTQGGPNGGYYPSQWIGFCFQRIAGTHNYQFWVLDDSTNTVDDLDHVFTDVVTNDDLTALVNLVLGAYETNAAADIEITNLKFAIGITLADVAEIRAELNSFTWQKAGGTKKFWRLETVDNDTNGLKEGGGAGPDFTNTGAVNGASRPTNLEAAPSTATFTQSHFRIRNDDGNEAGATYRASEDTQANISLDINYRVRAQIDTNDGDPGSTQFRIEAKLNSGSYFPLIPPPTQQVVTQTTPGDYSFVVPAHVHSIQFEGIGGGGAGSRRSTNGAGGGGSGGAYVKSTISVTPGDTIPYHVGAGATQAASPANGEDTTWNTSVAVAKGGVSVAANTTTGATAPDASASTGDTKFKGGNGANGTAGSFGGGGGSSAGTASDGTNATGQPGATAPSGGGNGGNGRNTTAGAGTIGSAPGGGGGGALRTSSGTQNGGSGAAGKVVITYIATPPVVLSPSSNIAAGGTDVTTALLTPPGAKTTADFQDGNISDDTNPLAAIDLATGKYTELEFCFKAISALVINNDVITFKITKNGTDLNTYTVSPTVQASVGVATEVDESSAVTDDVSAIKVWPLTINETTAAVEKFITASRVVVSQDPASYGAYSGQVFVNQPAFALTDVGGLIVTDANVLMSLSILSGPGNFIAGGGFLHLTNNVGVVSFTDIGLDTPGTYVLRCTCVDQYFDTAIGHVDTVAFEVQAAPLSADDGGAAVDSNSVLVTYKPQQDSSVGIVDDASASVSVGGSTIPVSASDGGGLTDTLSYLLTIPLPVNEAGVVIDTISADILYTLPDEVAQVVEAVNAVVNILESNSDAAALADDISLLLKIDSILEGAQVVSDLIYLLTIHVTIDETVNAVDQTDIDNSGTSSDDSGSVADSADAFLTISTQVNEGFNVSEQTVGDIQGGISVLIDDSAVAVDQVTVKATYAIVINEGVLARGTPTSNIPATAKRHHLPWWRRRRRD